MWHKQKLFRDCQFFKEKISIKLLKMSSCRVYSQSFFDHLAILAFFANKFELKNHLFFLIKNVDKFLRKNALILSITLTTTCC